METYRSGHNELDSKSSCRVTGTRVQIPPSPPLVNNTNPRQSEFVLFFERDYFGVCVGMNIASPKPPTPTAWQTQKRDEKGNFTK